jgi:hypothetical protein
MRFWAEGAVINLARRVTSGECETANGDNVRLAWLISDLLGCFPCQDDCRVEMAAGIGQLLVHVLDHQSHLFWRQSLGARVIKLNKSLHLIAHPLCRWTTHASLEVRNKRLCENQTGVSRIRLHHCATVTGASEVCMPTREYTINSGDGGNWWGGTSAHSAVHASGPRSDAQVFWPSFSQHTWRAHGSLVGARHQHVTGS